MKKRVNCKVLNQHRKNQMKKEMLRLVIKNKKIKTKYFM